MKFLILFLSTFICGNTSAQAPVESPLYQRGIELFREGRYADSVKAFEEVLDNPTYQNNAATLSHLGLAYLHSDKIAKARKSAARAVKLEPSNADWRANLAYIYLMDRQLDDTAEHAVKALELEPRHVFANYVLAVGGLWEGNLGAADAYIDKILTSDPGYAAAYALRSDIMLARVGRSADAGLFRSQIVEILRNATHVLEQGLGKVTPAVGKNQIGAKLESMRAFHDYYSTQTLDENETGITPFRIKRKPHAGYTDNARSAGAEGSIRLAVLLGANGKVLHVLRLSGIGYGLDEQAVAAARSIEFEPKKKDGKPVQTVVTVEYSFSIY